MLEAEFFSPPGEQAQSLIRSGSADSLASVTTAFSSKNGFPDTDGAHFALIGVPEFRGADHHENYKSGCDSVREKLYQLKKHNRPVSIVDLGNIAAGNTIEDTYFALTGSVQELLRKQIIPIILGGSQDLTVAQFNAYQQFNKLVNITGIDSRFDLGMPDDHFGSTTWLGKIIMQQPNYLFNFSNIGYQTYFVGSGAVQLMSNLYFDAYRVGEVRTDISESEPVIRNANLVTFDMGAVRQSDAPGAINSSPNGFNGEEACQLMYYAGLNDRLSSVGIYEFNQAADRAGQTAHLIAQMIWYFIEGVHHRKNDFPREGFQGMIRYNVTVGTNEQEMVFLKHKSSNRWWIEMPEMLFNNSKHLPGFRFLPCSYSDYQLACNHEMPDRYWQAIQKL